MPQAPFTYVATGQPQREQLPLHQSSSHTLSSSPARVCSSSSEEEEERNVEQHGHKKGFIDYHTGGRQKRRVCDTTAAADLLTSGGRRVPLHACSSPAPARDPKHFEVISANCRVVTILSFHFDVLPKYLTWGWGAEQGSPRSYSQTKWG